MVPKAGGSKDSIQVPLIEDYHGDGIDVDVDAEELDTLDNDQTVTEVPICYRVESGDDDDVSEVILGATANDLVIDEAKDAGPVPLTSSVNNSGATTDPAVQAALMVPHLKRIMKELWNEQRSESADNSGKQSKGSQQNEQGQIIAHNRGMDKGGNLIKSPSDTTIYVPALCKQVQQATNNIASQLRNDPDREVLGTGRANANFTQAMVSDAINRNNQQINQQVSSFVEAVRAEQDNGKDTSERTDDTEAEQYVLQAEKFKATIVPPGQSSHSNMLNDQFYATQPQAHCSNTNLQPQVHCPDLDLNNGTIIPEIGKGVSDDDFFHLTCFIEPSLIHKIEKGEFVELDKLLPKDRNGSN